MDQTLSKIKKLENESKKSKLKKGLTETDKDIYFNLQIIWPLSTISSLSVVFFIIGIGFMEYLDHITLKRYSTNELSIVYGRRFLRCTNYYPLEKNFYPSILRQVEIKLITNISFRVIVCVPILIRIFTELIVKYYLRVIYVEHLRNSKIFYFFNELNFIIAVIEVVSQAIFSVINLRLDFPGVYRLSFCIFIGASSLHMLLRIVLSLMHKDKFEFWDKVSILIKTISTLLYFWTVTGFFWNHMSFINEPPCHGYVPLKDAIIEYIVFISYFLFHVTVIIDFRRIRIICYPSMSECQLLKSDNFNMNERNDNCCLNQFKQQQVDDDNSKLS